METLVINIDNKSNAKRILNAIRLFKGVKKALIADDEKLENISILKACEAGMKTKNVSKQQVLEALK